MAQGVAAAKAWLAGQDGRQRPDHLARGCAPLASGPGLDLRARRHGRLRSRHQRPVDPDRDPARARPSAVGRAGLPREPADAHRRAAAPSRAASRPISTGSRTARRPGTSSSRPMPGRWRCGWAATSSRSAAGPSRGKRTSCRNIRRFMPGWPSWCAGGASEVDLAPMVHGRGRLHPWQAHHRRALRLLGAPTRDGPPPGRVGGRQGRPDAPQGRKNFMGAR